MDSVRVVSSLLPDLMDLVGVTQIHVLLSEDGQAASLYAGCARVIRSSLRDLDHGVAVHAERKLLLEPQRARPHRALPRQPEPRCRPSDVSLDELFPVSQRSRPREAGQPEHDLMRCAH